MTSLRAERCAIVDSDADKAKIGISGRNSETKFAVEPVSVKATINYH